MNSSLVSTFNIRDGELLTRQELVQKWHESLGETGQKRQLREDYRGFWELEKKSSPDLNPDLWSTVQPFLADIEVPQKSTIVTSRNCLKKLLLAVSFDPKKENERHFAVTTDFSFRVRRHDDVLVLQREVFKEEPGIGVHFEQLVTTALTEASEPSVKGMVVGGSFQRIAHLELDNVHVFVRHEVDCVDSTNRSVELKTVNLKPKKWKKHESRSRHSYNRHDYYSIDEMKYRLYWTQMSICNTRQLIVGMVLEETESKKTVVVDYQELGLSDLRTRAWVSNPSGATTTYQMLTAVLKWLQKSVTDDLCEYIVEYNRTDKDSQNLRLFKVTETQQSDLRKTSDETEDDLTQIFDTLSLSAGI